MFTAIILIPPLTYLYNKLDLVDMPTARKVHTVPIPRVGGVAIVIATIIPVAGWVELNSPLLSMLFAIAILFVLGIVDDAKNLSYKSKFLFQILSIALVFIFGFIDVDQSYFVFNDILHGFILLAVYFIFILGVTNAINLSDGLDGLAGGEALLSFAIIGLLAYETGNLTIALIVLAVIGSIFGFLRFNTYPAKIFMGDTGSLFLGFVLGVLSVALTYGADNAYAKTLPLLLVGLPVFDTVMVMLIRLGRKQSPFNADRNHLHHKLLDNGYKHYQSVLMIYLMQSIYILSAYYMRFDSDANIVLMFIFISTLVFAISLIRFDSCTLQSIPIHARFSENVSSFRRRIITVNADKLFAAISLLMTTYVISSLFDMQSFKYDILVLLSIIALLAIYGLIFKYRKPCGWLERIAIHIMIVMSIYFGSQADASPNFNILHISLLFIIVFLITLLLLGDKHKRFIGSPLDFLLVATAIVIPNLPDSPLSDSGISAILIELLVLFYCIEYVLFNVKNNWWAIRLTLALSAVIPIFMNFM